MDKTKEQDCLDESHMSFYTEFNMSCHCFVSDFRAIDKKLGEYRYFMHLSKKVSFESNSVAIGVRIS